MTPLITTHEPPSTKEAALAGAATWSLSGKLHPQENQGSTMLPTLPGGGPLNPKPQTLNWP